MHPLHMAVRATLGVLLWAAFISFSKAVQDVFNERVARFTILLTAFQAHLPFYMSRTLPNTFALAISEFQ